MWVVLALLCAFSLASCDALTRKVLRTGADEFLVGWLRLAFAAPPLLALLFVIEVPPLGPRFLPALALALPLEVLSFVLYVRALRVSPMSLSLPFLAFTPVFVIGVGWAIVGERPSLQGAGGVVLLALGGYALFVERGRGGWLAPLRAMARERGAMLMLLVSFIYAFTASFLKLGLLHSSPLFFGAVYFTVLPVLYAPLGLAGRARGAPLGRNNLLLLVAAGLLMAAMVVTHMLGVSMTNVAYMVAVKRTSMLMGVVYGCLFFGEGRLRDRLPGAALMFAGFAVTATA
jgi:drug/metabolite transporter (DMT)-like permease